MSLSLPDKIQFESVASAIEFFRKGRTFFNPDIIAKQWINSIYWNRWTTMPWPINTTDQQTAFRFPRSWYDDSLPWNNVQAAGNCGTDGCGGVVNVINMSPSEEYNFSLLEKDFMTDKFCIDKWLFDLFPSEQLTNFIMFLAGIQQREIQNFMRANMFARAGKHWMATATDGEAYCGQFDPDGWYMPISDSGAVDFNFVYVNKDPSDLGDIALLSYDVLQDVYQSLARQQTAYRNDLVDLGITALDVLVPDAKTARRIFLEGKYDSGNWFSESGFTEANKDLRLGIKRTVGDFMFAYDDTAFKYNYDSVYNATVSYNANDPTSWPRLVRVPDYIKVPAQGAAGCKGDDNPAYFNADFAISFPQPAQDQITLWTSPNPSFNGLPTSTPNFMGDWDMKAYPFSDNNLFENVITWVARFRNGFQMADPTVIQPILHRLDNRRVANGGCCPINTTYVAGADPDCYNCSLPS